MNYRWQQLVGAIRAVHSKREFSGDGYGWSVCVEDRQSWPCATIEALEATLGDLGEVPR